MILHTIIPLEKVLENIKPDEIIKNTIDMEYNGVILELHKESQHYGIVTRIISTNPNDYLNPIIQPGSQVNIST